MSQDSSQELEEDRVTWQSRHVEEVPTFALQDESQEEEELLFWYHLTNLVNLQRVN